MCIRATADGSFANHSPDEPMTHPTPTIQRPLHSLISELAGGMYADAVTHRHGPDGPCRFCGDIVTGELCRDHAEVARYAELLAELRAYDDRTRADACALEAMAQMLDEHMQIKKITAFSMASRTFQILSIANRF